MLLNVVAVAMQEGRMPEAVEASRKALEIGPPEGVSEHVIVLDYYDALAPGRSDEGSLRPTVREGMITPFYKMLRGLAQDLHEAARTDVDSRKAFRLARDAFRAACYPRSVWKRDAILQALRKETARNIAMRCGGLSAWMWKLSILASL